MRAIVFSLLFLAFTTPVSAQEAGSSSGAPIVTATPSMSVMTTLEEVLAQGLAPDVYRTYRAPMVHPRVCVRHEFRFGLAQLHPWRGQILRIEQGECLLEHPYYLINPETRRIGNLEDEEAVVEALRSLPSTREPLAPDG